MSNELRCGFNGCKRGGKLARGLCMGHYKQWQLGKDLTPLKPYRIEQQPPCAFDGCDLPQRTKGWCKAHYMQQWYGTPLKPLGPAPRRECSFRGCRRGHNAKGLCVNHYRQMRLGQDLHPLRVWEYKPWHDQHGYLLETASLNHPNARVRKGRSYAQIFQHIRVMSEMLGRPLLPGENVHHRNGVKDDNRPENLELWLRSQPSGQRVTDLLAWAREIVGRYEPVEDKL
jgi:hypothetical protein